MSQSSIPAAQTDPAEDSSSEASDATVVQAAFAAANLRDPFLLKVRDILEDAFKGDFSAADAKSKLEDVVLEARIDAALR